MAKPTYSASIPNLRDDFSAYMRLIESGKSIEVTDRRTVVGIIAPNINEETSEHLFTESHASTNLRGLFDLVEAGKKVVVTRMGGKLSLVITKPDYNEPK